MEKEYDHDHLRTELSQAFRIVDKWCHNDRFNSAVIENIFEARYSLQSALENLSVTEEEIEQRRSEKEHERDELQEQIWQGEQEELHDQIDDILKSLNGNEPPKKLSFPQASVVGEVLKECMHKRPLSDVESNAISSLLKEF